MQITLTRTGGIIPVTKRAEKEVEWTENEIERLIEHMRAEDIPGTIRDNTSYELSYDNKSFSIDLEKVPTIYKKLFDDLKDNLKIVKPR